MARTCVPNAQQCGGKGVLCPKAPGGCCAPGEWCENNETCRCGSGDACTGGLMCFAGGIVGPGPSQCGTTCCGDFQHPCPL